MVMPGERPVTSPLPYERDVCLAVILAGMSLRYVACLTAALIFVQIWPGRVLVVDDPAAAYPRLPTERLYVEP
ncbi:hypothetical protein SAMN05421776_103653 [Nocardia farcinica]|uniref:Uncharacterized protein n=1 Tax=Nocardia farcinica TaxID=37329 RepID=A0A0H5P1B0_NOCFR|nr:hypothetical protein CJ469_02273 [Nocardia farcinica]PFX08378.1 hypothetical protein CJ468_02555 [Nocardia farcinica]CRY81695.1 Uncharacterised protein [Nocardia farcinica]SIT15135.1 hypothetical protein SAMN05421776_103653 [Nocardia farcinica]SUE31850.1 Uncharacterised protein [Nocardia farcinica]